MRALSRTTTRLRIIVLGYIVRAPLGGLAWHHLQYVMGLTQLGHDVFFVEDSDDYPCCYDPVRNIKGKDPTLGLRFAKRTFDSVELGDRWAYYDAHTSNWLGPCGDRILDICAAADLLLNLSGMNPLRPWLMGIPVRCLIDTDPVFMQIRHLTDPEAWNLALQHTAFFSFGENIGQAMSSIPDDGLPWQVTRQPVVLEAWQSTPGPSKGMFSTVMLWDSYQARDYNGRRYGLKSDSFGPYMDLPEKAGPIFELAVGSPSAPGPVLAGKGWAVRDPREPTRDLWTYQGYIRRSKAEFSVAKHGYVVSCSGWFSERSAVYLASGRPVLVQDTGFSEWLETGNGVIPFNTLDDALAGIEAINSRYEFHCRSARAVAEAFFDAKNVLPRLIESAMNGQTSMRRIRHGSTSG